jgi:hypothetical protein
MDRSAANRPAEDARRSPETRLPPLTLRTLGEMLGHKNVEETEVFVRSVGDRRKLLDMVRQRDPQAFDRYAAAGRSIETEVDDLYKTFEAKTTWLGKTWNFIKRNKWKIAGGALAVGAGVAAWYYWPQIAAWAAGAGEAARQWVRGWLGIPDVGVPAAPDLPGGGLPGGGGAPPVEIAPPPRVVPVIPDVPAPPTDLPM